VALRVRISKAAHAEIENLWLAILIDEDVRRLQIAVNEPALVRVLHPGIAELRRGAVKLHSASSPTSSRPVEYHARITLRATMRCGISCSAS
jgi:hypothetical protein